MAADPLSRVFSALADPTRRDIVARLAGGDATVNELAAPYDVTVQAVSKHVKVLEDAGLVSRSRDAQRRPVHLEAEVFDLMTKWIERHRSRPRSATAASTTSSVRCPTTRTHPTNPDRSSDMTMTTTHETTISADPDVPLVRITRELDAPPAEVFRAHTDADIVVQWLGPRDLEMRVVHYDCRTGGSYRYVHVRGEEEYRFRGCFHEVRPAELIVQTFTFEGVPDAVALERLEFEDLGDDRTRLTATSLVDSFEGRDAFLSSGMEEGIRQSYERLDEVLAG